MGREAKCHARCGSDAGDGKALLEPNEIIFRGTFRLVIPLKAITALDVRGETLHISFGTQRAEFDLGAAEAAKWLKAIREPKSVFDKLGVKAGQRVQLIGLNDSAFQQQLQQRGAEFAESDLDHVFFAVDSADELSRMKALKVSLKQNGALWVLRPKGRKDLTEAQTMAAGKAAGLVDVKVVGFSATLSAEKYVIPVNARKS